MSQVISIYAGKLMLRSDLKTAQGAMLTMKAKAEWPPQRGHRREPRPPPREAPGPRGLGD